MIRWRSPVFWGWCAAFPGASTLIDFGLVDSGGFGHAYISLAYHAIAAVLLGISALVAGLSTQTLHESCSGVLLGAFFTPVLWCAILVAAQLLR